MAQRNVKDLFRKEIEENLLTIESPLHEAVEKGNVLLVQLLVEEYGMSPFVKNEQGVRAMDAARELGYLDIERYLRNQCYHSVLSKKLDDLKREIHSFILESIHSQDAKALQLITESAHDIPEDVIAKLPDKIREEFMKVEPK